MLVPCTYCPLNVFMPMTGIPRSLKRKQQADFTSHMMMLVSPAPLAGFPAQLVLLAHRAPSSA